MAHEYQLMGFTSEIDVHISQVKLDFFPRKKSWSMSSYKNIKANEKRESFQRRLWHSNSSLPAIVKTDVQLSVSLKLALYYKSTVVFQGPSTSTDSFNYLKAVGKRHEDRAYKILSSYPLAADRTAFPSILLFIHAFFINSTDPLKHGVWQST